MAKTNGKKTLSARQAAAVCALALAGLTIVALGRGPSPRPLQGVHVRTWRETTPTLPSRALGRAGRDGAPFNVIIVGKEDDVRKALRDAGWSESPLAAGGPLRSWLSMLVHGADAPALERGELRGRPQSMNWVIPGAAARQRHQLRLWRSGDVDDAGREIRPGTADYALGLRWRDLTSVAAPDLDRERDLLVASLRKGVLMTRRDRVQLKDQDGEGVDDKGDPYRTDGWTAVIELGSGKPTHAWPKPPRHPKPPRNPEDLEKP